VPQKIAPTGWVDVCSASDREAPMERVGTGHGRGALTAGHGGIWVANRGSRSVARLDPRTHRLTATLGVRKFPAAIASGGNAVWVVCSNGWLWRVWPAGPRAEGVARLGRRARAIAAAGGWIWVLRENGRLDRLEPATGEVIATTRMPGGARRMIGTGQALWVAARRGRLLLRIAADSGQIDAEIRVPKRIVSLAADDTSIFAGCVAGFPPRHGWLYEVDRQSASLGAPLELPGQPRALAAGPEAVWIACSTGRHRGTIERLAKPGGTLESWRQTDWNVSDLLLDGDSLLIAMSMAAGPPDGGGGWLDGGAHVGGLGGGDFGGGGDGGGGGGN
jgi:hypothetical protein